MHLSKGSALPVLPWLAGGEVMTGMREAKSGPSESAAWVGQEDAEGCALATLAMICGHDYAAVKAEVETYWPSDEPAPGHDWSKNGVTFYTLDRYLAAQGYFMQRRYATWGLPLEPFAPIHYASVQQPSNRSHFVVVLADGGVLDPLREGRFALSDWTEVNQLGGLVKP